MSKLQHQPSLVDISDDDGVTDLTDVEAATASGGPEIINTEG